MRMVPQLQMGFFYITQEELSRVVEALSPFRESTPTKQDIFAYLTQANGALVTCRDSPEQAAREYVTAASFYTFVRPLMHFNISPDLPASFARIIGKSPYKVKKPLEVIFRETCSCAENVSSLENLPPLLDIEEAEFDPRAVFTRSERFKFKMNGALQKVSGNLSHQYTHEQHFAFVGLYDVCFPLFGLRKKGAQHEDMGRKLREQYGSFSIQFPHCLAATIMEN